MDCDLSVKGKTECSEENRGGYLQDLGVNKDFFKSTIPKRINFTTIKNFCLSKGLFKRVKRRHRVGGDINNTYFQERILTQSIYIYR